MLWRIPFRSYLIPLAMGILYLFIGYFTTREQSVQFLVLSFGLFGLTYFSVQKTSINQILWQGILYRAVLLITL
ncbi:hypothetical protein N9E55_03755, partial [Flavobacteriaceae bacterium]|nr:hypothetical protein [Flavobacteriaceae bacterium]